MNARFEQDFAEQFSDMAEVAKPVSAAELKTLSDFQQGELDCLSGVEHKEGQSEAYNQGYSAQYEREARA